MKRKVKDLLKLLLLTGIISTLWIAAGYLASLI